jgi:hypothetical protein
MEEEEDNLEECGDVSDSQCGPSSRGQLECEITAAGHVTGDSVTSIDHMISDPTSVGHVTSGSTTSVGHVTSDATPSVGQVISDPMTSAGDVEEALEDGECLPGEGILDAILADAAGLQATASTPLREMGGAAGKEGRVSNEHPTTSEEVSDAPAGEGLSEVGVDSAAGGEKDGNVRRRRKRKPKGISRQEKKRRKVNSTHFPEHWVICHAFGLVSRLN